MKTGKILSHIDIPALRAFARTLLEAGHTRDEVVDQVTDLIDAAVPWDALGPIGAAVDAIDGPVVKALVKFILDTAHAKKARAEAPRG